VFLFKSSTSFSFALSFLFSLSLSPFAHSSLLSFFSVDETTPTTKTRRGLPMPHKQEILTVVGDPIDVVQCDAPTQEQVDEVHAKLCRALCDMFEGHKGKLGPEWAEKKMVIV